MVRTKNKSVLSLLLAFVMLVGVAVLVATVSAPKAEAATAGTYDVKVYLDISNTMYCNGTQNITLYTKSNNGTGSEDGGSKQEFSTYNTGSVTKEWSNTGFPSKVTCYCGGSTWNNAGVKFGINVYVRKAGTTDSDWTAIYTEGNDARSHTAGFFATVGSFTETLNITSNKPYAKTVVAGTGFSDKTVTANIKGGAAVTTTATATIQDQYGVNWYQDPDWSISTDNWKNGTTGQVTCSSGQTTTVSIPATHRLSTTKTVVLKASKGNASSEITITVQPKYKVSFNTTTNGANSTMILL